MCSFISCNLSGVDTRNGCRPDFLLWLSGKLLFWGEEKAVSSAEDALRQKFAFIDPADFGEIKFMLGYAVNGSKIRFYAFEGALRQADPFIPLTYELDLTILSDRSAVLKKVINIARILITVKDSLPPIDYPLGRMFRAGASKITFNFDGVEKQLDVKDLPYVQTNASIRVKFLKQMYKHAHGHSGLVQVKEDSPTLNSTKTHCWTELSTKGVSKRPSNEAELRRMTKDLVLGLSRLHQGNYLHRDIRWPNIVYDRANLQYVLIDFEHGGSETRKKGRKKSGSFVDDGIRLNGWDDETLDGEIYTKTSDMHQLGRLLGTEFGYLDLSNEGQDFVAKMTEKKMTAEDSLRHGWISSLYLK